MSVCDVMAGWMCVSDPVNSEKRFKRTGVRVCPFLSFIQHYCCSLHFSNRRHLGKKVGRHLGGPVVWNPEPPSQPARLLLGIEPDQLFPHDHIFTRSLCVWLGYHNKKPGGLHNSSNTWAWA